MGEAVPIAIERTETGRHAISDAAMGTIIGEVQKRVTPVYKVATVAAAIAATIAVGAIEAAQYASDFERMKRVQSYTLEHLQWQGDAIRAIAKASGANMPEKPEDLKQAERELIRGTD